MMTERSKLHYSKSYLNDSDINMSTLMVVRFPLALLLVESLNVPYLVRSCFLSMQHQYRKSF